MLVDDLVGYINQEHEDYFSPLAWICVDESISRWYGIGGSWINDGLPEYRAMDRKPENGCEVQNACDGQSGIMLHLNKDLNHGTKVLAFFVMPWARSLRTVVADSYYASFQTVCSPCALLMPTFFASLHWK